jgi:hypothetical protein
MCLTARLEALELDGAKVERAACELLVCAYRHPIVVSVIDELNVPTRE